MTSDKIRALIDAMAAANYLSVSQFNNPSWNLCADKRFWIEDATRSLHIAMPEIIEWCAQVVESHSSGMGSETEFQKGLNHAARAVRKLKDRD